MHQYCDIVIVTLLFHAPPELLFFSFLNFISLLDDTVLDKVFYLGAGIVECFFY